MIFGGVRFPKLALTRSFNVELRGFEPLTSSMPWHSDTCKTLVLCLPHGHRRAGSSAFDRGRWLAVWLAEPGRSAGSNTRCAAQFAATSGAQKRVPPASRGERDPRSQPRRRTGVLGAYRIALPSGRRPSMRLIHIVGAAPGADCGHRHRPARSALSRRCSGSSPSLGSGVTKMASSTSS
jgi:hypothetical protein